MVLGGGERCLQPQRGSCHMVVKFSHAMDLGSLGVERTG